MGDSEVPALEKNSLIRDADQSPRGVIGGPLRDFVYNRSRRQRSRDFVQTSRRRRRPRCPLHVQGVRLIVTRSATPRQEREHTQEEGGEPAASCCLRKVHRPCNEIVLGHHLILKI